jgi:hypothetical protein
MDGMSSVQYVLCLVISTRGEVVEVTVALLASSRKKEKQAKEDEEGMMLDVGSDDDVM